MKLFAWNTFPTLDEAWGIQYYAVAARSVEIARKKVIEYVKKSSRDLETDLTERIKFIKETEPISFEEDEVVMFAYIESNEE